MFRKRSFGSSNSALSAHWKEALGLPERDVGKENESDEEVEPSDAIASVGGYDHPHHTTPITRHCGIRKPPPGSTRLRPFYANLICTDPNTTPNKTLKAGGGHSGGPNTVQVSLPLSQPHFRTSSGTRSTSEAKVMLGQPLESRVQTTHNVHGASVESRQNEMPTVGWGHGLETVVMRTRRFRKLKVLGVGGSSKVRECNSCLMN